MSQQRLKIDPGTQRRETRDLSRQLKGVRLNYRFGIIDKRRAKTLGKRIIDDHYQTLLRLTGERFWYATRRRTTIAPEDQLRLDRWRDEAISDFEAIIDDIR